MTALEPHPQRPALRCAEPHPLLPELLCGRLSGHGGIHSSDEDTAWDEWDCATEGERGA